MITKPLSFKRILTTFILVAFLAVALFSFVVMLHGPGEQMIGDCPFSAMDVALCPADILNFIVHHISAYNSFFNIPVGFYVTTVIISLLFFASILVGLSLFEPSPPLVRLFNYPLITSPGRKVTRWLSLLENSPSR